MAHAKTKFENEETQRLREEVETLRGDFASLTRELKSFIDRERHDLDDKASNRIVALKKVGEHELDLARRYAADAGRVAENTVREHPGYAVAGAAALGFLLGALALRHR